MSERILLIHGFEIPKTAMTEAVKARLRVFAETPRDDRIEIFRFGTEFLNRIAIGVRLASGDPDKATTFSLAALDHTCQNWATICEELGIPATNKVELLMLFGICDWPHS